MSKSTPSYPALSVTTTGTSIVSGAGGVLLARTAEKVGLNTAPPAPRARARAGCPPPERTDHREGTQIGASLSERVTP